MTELYDQLDMLGGKKATKAQKKLRQQLLTELPAEATAGYGMYKQYSKQMSGMFSDKALKGKGKDWEGYSTEELGIKGVFGADADSQKFKSKKDIDTFLKGKGATGSAGLRPQEGTGSTAASEGQIRDAMKNMLESQNKVNGATVEAIKTAASAIGKK